MATMIPEKPIEIQEGSREDEMFIALSKLPDEYYVFHSFVLISNTEGILRESETDFIIFHAKKGILCIEAKAGHVYCDRGTWFYGSHIPMRHGGPYRQADINKWKLEKYFEQKGILGLWQKCKTLHAVWFPSVKKAELNTINFPPEADKAITLTEESLTSIENDIEKIFTLELPSGVETSLTNTESKKILENILCPSFDLVPSVVSELGVKRNAFNRLLKEQANILNFLEDQHYAVINGVAGTGKTMIALEKARRHAEEGEKVLFLCFNRMLCDYFRLNYMHNNIFYYTIDALACSYCNTSTADYRMLYEKLELAYYDNAYPFKHVIIDEGQDFGQDRIEETDIINLLETIALSEEVDGSFYLFYDKNQLVQGSRIPKYISDSDCKLTLYKNCRNTENIAITSMRPLGIDSKPKMFKGCVKGESPKIFITDSIQKQKDFLDLSIKQLKDTKIKDIVILSCATEEQSTFYQYCSNGNYICNGSTYKFTTCRKFKGLEADAIIIVDVTKKTLASSNLNFYVGASRARFYLSVICQMSDEDCFEVLKHFDTAIAKKPKKALAAALNSMLVL